MAKNHNRNS